MSESNAALQAHIFSAGGNNNPSLCTIFLRTEGQAADHEKIVKAIEILTIVKNRLAQFNFEAIPNTKSKRKTDEYLSDFDGKQTIARQNNHLSMMFKNPGAIDTNTLKNQLQLISEDLDLSGFDARPFNI